jgi:phosphatidylinositol alpha 1,6-mannosyltransferase
MRDRSDAEHPRVLYFTDTYPPQVNGVSVVTELSVRGLRERGWECMVVAPQYPAILPHGPLRRPNDSAVHSIPSVAFPPYPDIRFAAPLYGACADVVRRFKPDVVHCATEFMIGRMGQIAAKRAGRCRLSSYHTDFSRYTEAYGVPALRGLVSRYIARFHRRSERVYTPSVPACHDLARLGVTSVDVWGRGVDTQVFSPERRSSILKSASGTGDAVLFLHVGRLAAEKRVDTIVRAFNRARMLLPVGAVRLAIAGAGPHEGALRRMAGPDVLFLGVLERDQALPRIYASADAFLFSSLTETLGLVVLEAMSSGLPVIATPAGGVADHLRHDQNGIAIGPHDVEAMADAIVSLTLDESRRRRLSAEARRTALALEWQAELDRLDSSYRSVLRARAASAQPDRDRILASKGAASHGY